MNKTKQESATLPPRKQLLKVDKASKRLIQ